MHHLDNKIAPRPLGALLDGLMAGAWGQSRSWQSKASLVKALKADLGATSSRSLDYTRLSNLVGTWTSKGLSPASINRRLSVIRTALKEDLKAGALGAMPYFPTVAENNRKEEYFSPAQEEALVNALGGPSSPYGALVVFLVDTGARLSEALGLKPEDVQEDHVIFRDTKSTRGGYKARQVPLTRRAQEAAQVVLRSAYRSSSSVSHRISGAARMAGLEGLTAHALRHTCASRLLNRGASLVEVRDWLGHTSITVTERYAHLERNKLNHLVNKLEVN